MPLQDVKPGDENKMLGVERVCERPVLRIETERETVGGRCMFCHRELGDADGVMLGWWTERHRVVVSAGAYHTAGKCGERSERAEAMGLSRHDVQASSVDADKVDQILRDFRDWEPDALRAFVRTVLAMKRVA
jgi:hypothetical protein